MTDQQSKLALRISKLMAHADSATNADESAAFAAKAHALLEQHDLSLTDVERARLNEEDPHHQRYVSGPKLPPELRSGKRRAWQERITGIIAANMGCIMVVERGSTAFWLVGRESHTAAAEAVAIRIMMDCHRACEREYSRAHYKTGFKAAFRRAFAASLNKRMETDKQNRYSKLYEEHGDDRGAALVKVLDSALQHSRSWMNANMRTSTTYGLSGRSGFNSHGSAAGSRYGSNQNTNAPIGGGSTGGQKFLNA